MLKISQLQRQQQNPKPQPTRMPPVPKSNCRRLTVTATTQRTELHILRNCVTKKSLALTHPNVTNFPMKMYNQ